MSLVVYGSVDNSTIKFYLTLILIEVGLHGLTLFAIKSPNVKYICKERPVVRAPHPFLHP